MPPRFQRKLILPNRCEAERYAERVASWVERVFGERTVGVWLLGSLAYGGFGPESDVDIQTAVREPTSAEIATLADGLAHPGLPCPAAGLEFVLYDVRRLVQPTPPLRWSLNLNGGPSRASSISTDPRTQPAHWFVLDLAIGREHARTLRGEPLASIAGPIAVTDQRRAIAESIAWHRQYAAGGRDRFANAARALLFLNAGRWTSKPTAVQWASSLGYSTEEIERRLAVALRSVSST